MTHLYFKKSDKETQQVILSPGESVLNGLLRSGVQVPYGCRSGVCQSCIMQTQDTEIPNGAQVGLRETQKEQGYFLSCCCKPTETMIVSLSDIFQKETTTVLDKTMLSDDIVRLRVEKKICYRSGQYMTLWKDDKTARTYSLASHPSADNYIEFHLRIYPDGVFSKWVADSLNIGDQIDIQGPMGSCFYSRADKGQPLFLSGIGTGLAPLYGIARDALLQGHADPIHLLVGAKSQGNLYLEQELVALQQAYPQLHIHYSLQSGDSDNDIYQMAQQILPDFKGIKVFLCGADSFVKKMKKQCFLAGANMGDIASDVFLSFKEPQL